ncbi:MAG: SRPBCC domain-containing protein [Solirubrobacteraceae bacterium]
MPDHRDDDLTPLTAEDERLLLGDGEPELAPGAVRRERTLGVPADAAWGLLRDADGLSRWLADDVDVVVAPGELGTARDADGAHRAVEIEEVEPGRRVALRWWTDEDDAAVVDVVLDDLGDGTSRITVTEIPLRVVAMPDTVPAEWSTGGGGVSGGPQMLALACR